MALIVIAGKPRCQKYAFAEFVASILENKLPHFKFRRIVIDDEQWDRWLQLKCQTHEWNYKKCPLVWRELAMTGGKEILIGGLSEFLEYCYEYYGLKAFLTEEERQMLADNNAEKFSNKKKETGEYNPINILISGANSHILPVLLSQLLKLPRLGTKNSIVVSLYDNSNNKHHLKQAQKDSTLMGANAGLNASKILDTLEEGLVDCDIFIILDDFARKGDDIDQVYKQNYAAMLGLAKLIDEIAPAYIRVILAGSDDTPLCFNATVLANESMILPLDNVVVVSAHLGLEAMPVVTKLTKTKTHDFASPAVWGFLGLNQYVDFDNMLYKAIYFVPNKRALKRIPNSTLPQGNLITELRRFIYMTESIKHVLEHIQQFKKSIKELTDEPNRLPKVKAIVALLTLWYSTEYDGEVMSLGIASDGTFGIPNGIVFSQPALLINGLWKPYAYYPMPEVKKCKIDDLADASLKVLQKYANKIANKILQYVDGKKNMPRSIITITEEKEVDRIECYEFPKPFEILKELRLKNQTALNRFTGREKLEREEYKIKNCCDIALIDNRPTSRSSSQTFRMSFHSIQSLQKREEALQLAEDKKRVKGIIKGILEGTDIDGIKEEITTERHKTKEDETKEDETKEDETNEDK